jgi:aminopeptidase S
VPSGVNDLVTAASTSGSNGDIDGGSTSIQSPPIALPSGIPTLTFAYYLAHRNDSSAG